ncbi:hypothetical protein ACRE1U_04650 [Helicobacter himalayensis]|uniref:hypothetical protein n=1 Tax=Helicobacter himalayensis TaxID=1591088 RepID=UPI003D701E9E
MASLCNKRFFKQNAVKALLKYLVIAFLGAGISSGVFLMCEIFFFLPFYFQTPFCVLCSFFSVEIILSLKHARALQKSAPITLPTTSIQIIFNTQGIEILQDLHFKEVCVPKGFVSLGVKQYFFLSHIIPYSPSSIKAFAIFDYFKVYNPQKAREYLFLNLLEQKNIFATIRAYVAFIHLSVFVK